MSGNSSIAPASVNGAMDHAAQHAATASMACESTDAHSGGITSTSAIPDFVQIGHVRYAIKNDHESYAEATEVNNETLWGRIEYGKSRIVLNPFQERQHEREALMHEVLHGIWHVSDPHNIKDEDVILRLAGVLVDTLRRNPDLIAYLVED